jgi:peptidoglycan L-alanyl-D-glutamate endopeptidase CwlK
MLCSVAIIRSIDALDPGFRPLAAEFIRRLAAAGVQYRVDETLRVGDTQEAYWLQGRAPLGEVNAAREKAGLYLLTEAENRVVVTWTRESAHLNGEALDVVPLLSRGDGRFFVPWNYAAYAGIWLQLGRIGQSLGLEWGGSWPPLVDVVIGRDPPHYQRRK